MKFLIILMVSFFSVFASAAPVKRLAQDVKLPTQGVIEQQAFTDLLAASATRVLSGSAGATSAAIATITTFAAQPDSPRNITVTPTGTTTDVEACVVVVNGTNIFDAAISENFTFLADASTAQTGAKAFKTVTSVVFPANCESGGFAATWNVGIGEKIGLKRCMAETGAFMTSSLNGVLETRATLAFSATAVESNTADFAGTMNGTNDFKAYFVQNFGCFP